MMSYAEIFVVGKYVGKYIANIPEHIIQLVWLNINFEKFLRKLSRIGFIMVLYDGTLTLTKLKKIASHETFAVESFVNQNFNP